MEADGAAAVDCSARVRAGEEIILAKGGKPYAKLVPLDMGEERRPGLVQGRLTEAFFEPPPPQELEAWER